MFNRRKELGIRELHGATSGRLLQLFMVEITLTLLITGVIAAAMLELISMYFAGEWTYYMNFSEGGSWVIKMGGDLAEYLIGVWLLMLVVGYGIIRQVRQATMLRNLQGGGIALPCPYADSAIGNPAGHLYVPDRSLLVYAESAKSLGKPDGRGDDPGGDGAYLCL